MVARGILLQLFEVQFVLRSLGNEFKDIHIRCTLEIFQMGVYKDLGFPRSGANFLIVKGFGSYNIYKAEFGKQMEGF